MTTSGTAKGASVFRAALAVGLVLVVVAAGAWWLSTPREPDVTADPLSAELRAFTDARPVRIGWYRDAEPLAIWDGDEAIGGYAVEEWNLIAIKLAFRVEHVPFDSIGEVVGALRNGDIDIAGGLGKRPDLAQFAAPTEPIAFERIVFFTRPEGAAQTIGDLAGRSVSTLPNSPLALALASRYPEATYVPTSSIAEGLEGVADQRIDLYVGPLALTGFVMRELGVDLVPLGHTIQSVPVLSWAVAGSESDALAGVARGELTDEEISLITVRWTGFDLGPDTVAAPVWRSEWFQAVVVVAVLMALFAFVLRRRVRKATEELSTLNAELEHRVETRTRDLDAAVSELGRSNEALAEFASTVAHDLRGPIGALGGFAQMLGRNDLPPDARDKMLDAIRSSSTRLVTLVDDLLTRSGRAKPAEAPFSLPYMDGPGFESWLRDVLGPELDAADATLTVEAPAGEIPVDVMVLQRTALNLAGNAVKYAVRDGQAGARIVARLAEASGGGGWVLVIEDDGPGIAVEDRERVFDLGFRGVADDRGRGMGLTETRDLLTRAGGSIDVGDSDLGGAQFTVHLPAATVAARAI